MAKRSNGSGFSRRGFIGAIGAAAAATALPVSVSAVEQPDGVLSSAQRWYEATVYRVTRGWEPRFRYRQYRPDEPDSGDWEEREAPHDELGDALAQLPILKSDATAYLVLAASEQVTDYGAAPALEAASAMALDVLARAERLGFFADPCPEALRFPDLPMLGCLEGSDDFDRAERDAESARNCAALARTGHRAGVFTAAELGRHEAQAADAERHLAAIRSGAIPDLTEAEKVAQHVARRRGIVLAYKARLAAAGRDASWVEVPPYWKAERLAQEGLS
jgi:hypothetical protein